MKHIKGLVLVSVLLFLTGCKISINSNNSIEINDNTGDNNTAVEEKLIFNDKIYSLVVLWI